MENRKKIYVKNPPYDVRNDVLGDLFGGRSKPLPYNTAKATRYRKKSFSQTVRTTFVLFFLCEQHPYKRIF